MSSNQIPFFKPSLGPEEAAELLETLRSGWLTTGAKTRRFEQEFARFIGRKHAVAVNSCTAALHLALEAIGLQAGEGVLVPTMTFAATAEVVDYFQARPILVDCRTEDFNLEVGDAWTRLRQAQAAGLRVVAVLPVDFGGLVGDVVGLRRLAQENALKVVEDAAHCCPAYYRNDPSSPWQSVGSEAEVACFSFYANKPITTGEGGMACTDNAAYAERMRMMSLHGISRDAWKRYTVGGQWYYEILAPGYKYNLTDLASAIGLQQLQKAERLHRQRQQVAEEYNRKLRQVEELILPQTLPNRVHSWHLYVIRLRLERLTLDRAQVIESLREAGISASVHYQPLHLHPYYRERFGYEPNDLPNAARLYPEILTLPSYPDMTEEDIEYVCVQLKSILAGHLRQPCRALRPLPGVADAPQVPIAQT